MTLTEIIEHLRIELADKDERKFTYDQLYFSIVETVALLSRMIPNYIYSDITVPSDHNRGEMIDISEIGNYIKIESVEYPVNRVPISLPSYKQWGDHIRLSERDAYFSPDDTVRIYYQAPHTVPTNDEEGSFPTHLNTAVIIGSAGNALTSKAGEYLMEAGEVADVQDILDEIANLTKPSVPDWEDLTAPSFSGSSPTLPDSPLGSVSWSVPGDCPSLPTVPTAPGDPPELPNPPTAPTPPADVDFPTAPTAPGAPPSLPSVPSPPTINWENMADALAAANLEIDRATEAGGYLETGEPLINAVTAGDRVGETYASYAGACISAAEAHIREASLSVERQRTRITLFANELNGYNYEASAELSKYRTEVEAYSAEVNAYTNEVNKILNRYSSEVQGYGSEVQAYSAEVNAKVGKYREELNLYNAEISAWSQEVQGILNKYRSELDDYSTEVNSYGHETTALNQKYSSEVAQFNAEVSNYSQEIADYRNKLERLNSEIAIYRESLNALVSRLQNKGGSVGNNIEVAERLRARGTELINNFYRLIGHKVETAVTAAPYQSKVTTQQ